VNDGLHVAVVGGGIIGCASAFELARRGARVTLFERSELAAGASGRNHGLLLAPLERELVPMAAGSTALYEEIHGQPDTPLPFHLDPEPIGFLIVAPSEEEREAARSEAEAAAACGVEVERVPGDGLRSLEPALAGGFVEGWLLRDARRLDPAALTVALATLASRHGADIRRHATVRSVLLEDGRASGVATDEGTFRADTVILAAGPWSSSLLRPLGIHLPLAGARGWLVQLAPDRPPVSRLVGRAGWHAPPGHEWTPPATAADFEAGGPAGFVSGLVQPNPDGAVVLGGSRQWAITNEPEDPAVPREIVRQAIGLVPSLAGVPVLSAWWGVRPMTPDGRPVIGEILPGLILATGHGSQGVILGGGTAALVAAIATGSAPPFEAAIFSPQRFAP
jgi:glycine/D-amino acid oxidase-like deaminating enzyme